MSASVAPVETVRSADGTVIAHRRLGRGPAVVALHGGLGSAASWAPVAERLADRYADLELPALVLAGSASPARQRRTCEDLARTLPGGEIAWLPDLGHVAHTAAPDTVAAALSSFLEALPPR